MTSIIVEENSSCSRSHEGQSDRRRAYVLKIVSRVNSFACCYRDSVGERQRERGEREG